MAKDFKQSLMSNISVKEEENADKNIEKTEIDNDENVKKFAIESKKKDKTNKKAFPLYLDVEKTKELDKICKRTGFSRNELIEKMITFCIENLEYK